MPADVTDQRQTRSHSSRGAVRIWLVSLCVLVFAIVIVGGATRLTDSGLSITEWQPIMGALPPFSAEDWTAAFEKYRQIPEYKTINRGMTLAEFKRIFWWEYAHRLFGRGIGIVFLVPFLWFWWSGRLKRSLVRRLSVIFVLGGAQGVLGWYMVMSGLVDRVDVSQYRLAAHLGLATILLGWLFWTAVTLDADPAPGRKPGARMAAVLVGLVFLQIIAGAFVAGLDAGQGYNTWPAMDGALIPSGLFAMSPFHLNFFENAMTVQFQHRMLAYLLVAIAVTNACYRSVKGAGDPVGAYLVLAALTAQLVLGIATLLARAPIALSLYHQAGAMLALLIALWHLARCTNAPAADRQTYRPAKA